MVNHKDVALDTVFSALSHATRRRTLEVLERGAASVSDLAAPHDISLAAFMKHMRVLEAAGLVACVKKGRTVTCTATPRSLHAATQWLASRERMWQARLDALGRHLYHRAEVAPVKKTPR